MNTNTTPIDVPRLIRIVTLLFAVLAGALVFFAYEPQTEALALRLDDAEAELRSDDIAFAEIAHLQFERRQLSERYAQLFAESPEAVFLRELAATAHRHGITLVSTSASPDVPIARDESPRALLFQRTRLALELRGTYRGLLTAIGELSIGPEIVEVGAPGLHRDRDRIVASVPITIYEPLREAHAPASAGEIAR
jgi:hypothetical protein